MEYDEERLDLIAKQIVDAALKVHKHFGPGLLESVYEKFLAHELTLRKFRVEKQVPVRVEYEGLTMESGLIIDLLIEGCVIIELKAVEKTLPVHEAQLLSYMRLAKKALGLLINFNVPLIKDGIKRMRL